MRPPAGVDRLKPVRASYARLASMPHRCGAAAWKWPNSRAGRRQAAGRTAFGPCPALHRLGPMETTNLIPVAGACFLVYHWAFGKAKVRYSTAAVERGDIESTVVAAGVLQPVNYVDVGAQTSGKLKSLKVKRGDQVVVDQLLAEIDPVLADTALTAANATLENMTSQRALKQAQLALTKVLRDRNEELFTQTIISRNDRDVTRTNYDVAVADVNSLSAQMRQASAAVDTAKANLSYTKITAPMAGEVVSITMLEGQT